MLATESFIQVFANGFSMISELIIGITTSLSNLGYWLSRLPIAVPITVGFLLFGLFNAFLLAGIFFLWNLKQRNLLTDGI